MKKENCLVCKNDNFKMLYRDTLLECMNCGFITANMQLTEQELKSLYSEKYFKGDEYSDYLSDKDVLQKNFTERLHYILKKSKILSSDNVLEIGCAYGFFAETLVKVTGAKNYLGLDISDEAIQYGKSVLGMNVVSVDYLKCPSPSTLYKHTFMWDVIEHLPHPELVIQKVSSETEPGGGLYITTGDISAMIPRIKKNKWRMIHPPTHLHYFSPNTISVLLKNYGFTVESVTYPRIYRSVKLVFYSLFILNKKPITIFEKIYNRIPDKWYFPFNSFDIMFVVAKKNL